ncbi:MAG TPA: Flp family type IVb pilin [Gaiellaceae bacterium]|jgi:pilus assembly protein Flp/PilA|nr:Flp family type IVb pilin [Gaiellaceae bacterium]
MEFRDWYELLRIQLKREEGQTMAEYGLLIALIAVLLVSTLVLFKGALINTFTSITNSL